MHPKQLIIDHYDSLVNKVDVYIEQLMEKYGDDELLEESESRAVTKDDYKKLDFKIVDDDDEDEESEHEEKIEKDKNDSVKESEEDDSDDEDPFYLLERRYIYSDYSEDEIDANECEDSEEDENDDEDSEDIEVDENEEKEDNETGESEDEQDTEDIEIDQEDKESKDDEDDFEDDLNNYSYHDYDEWDENDENIDDEVFYEELIYGIEGFTDPYYFDYKTDKQTQFELKERSSIKTKDYLNQVRFFMIDKIRKEETQQLESYEANKAGFEFDKNSSIGQIKKEIFKDRFCFLIDTKTDQIRKDFSTSREKKNRVFNLCLIITDFYLSRSQLNRIKYVLNQFYFCFLF